MAGVLVSWRFLFSWRTAAIGALVAIYCVLCRGHATQLPMWVAYLLLILQLGVILAGSMPDV